MNHKRKAATSNKCKKCASNVTAKLAPGITCNTCEHPFHWGCTGLSKEAIERIRKDPAKEIPSGWACDSCKRRSKIIEDLPRSTVQVNPDSSAAAISELKELLNSAVTRIAQLEAQVATLSEKSTQIDQLTSSIHTLDAVCNSLEKNQVDEYLEVQNLPESALEDPLATAIKIGQAIECAVTAGDFSSTPHREQRRLRLQFKCKSLRRKFLLAGKNFNKKKTPIEIANHKVKIYINQELTTFQRSLFDSTKRFATIEKRENCNPVVIHTVNTLNDEDLLPKCSRAPVEDGHLPSGSSRQ